MVKSVASLGILPSNTGAANSDAWEAAMSAIPPSSGAHWVFGIGAYEFARCLPVSARMIVEGVTGFDSNQCVVLRFRSGAGGGFKIYAGVGSGSILRHLYIFGNHPGVGSGEHGVRMEAPAKVEHCTIEDWDDGVHILANVTQGTNANGWNLEGVYANGNAGHGFYVRNTDANAGLALQCSANNNGLWGFWDQSFLGNTYVACQADGNQGGGYRNVDPNSRSTFVGCYAESGQAVRVDFPAVWVGGPRDNDGQYTGSGSVFSGDTYLNRSIKFQFKRTGPPGPFGDDRTGFVRVGGGNSEGTTLAFQRPAGDGGGEMICGYSDIGPFPFAFGFGAWLNPNQPAMAFGGDGAIMAAQPMELPRGVSAFAGGVYLGMNKVSFVPAKPVEPINLVDVYNEGDILFNRFAGNPGAVEKDHVGWVCTQSGNLGTYSEGLTATADGSNVIRLSSRSFILRIGSLITLGGEGVYKIVMKSPDALSLTLHTARAPGALLPIAYRPPKFRRFGKLEPEE